MTILCINCAKADLDKARVQLSGEVRKYPYTVEMEGLKCPNCGYSTVDSQSMAELGRLAADEYRRAHGLLTSDEIVALREYFDESQEAFAKRVGVGSASIKRWELGKIQDKVYDDLIRERTKRTVNSSSEYVYTYIATKSANTAWSTLESAMPRNGTSVVVLMPSNQETGVTTNLGANTSPPSWAQCTSCTDEQSRTIQGVLASGGSAVGNALTTTATPIFKPIIPRGYYYAGH
jgi:putative zinc finger/helix-turn-helix YgiT family protein